MNDIFRGSLLAEVVTYGLLAFFILEVAPSVFRFFRSLK